MNEIRRLVPYVKKFLPALIGAVVMLVACGALEALIIALLAPIFDQLAPVTASAGNAVDKFAFLRNMLGLDNDQYFLRVAVFLVVFSFFKDYNNKKEHWEEPFRRLSDLAKKEEWNFC